MKRLFGVFFLALLLSALVSISAFADSFTLVSTETGDSSDYRNIVSIKPGKSVTLNVVASGDIDGITYRWYRYDYNWSNYKELTCTDATLNTGALNSKYYYYCEANNSIGYSATCGFTVEIDNHFSLEREYGESQSGTVTAALGSSVTLKAIASGDDLSNVSFRWTRYTLSGGDQTTLEETSSTLVIPEVSNSYFYECNAQDGYGNTGYVSYTVKVENHFSLSASGSDNTWSVPVKAPYGQKATLNVIAHGDDLEGVTYQWYSYGSRPGSDKNWDVNAATLTTDSVTEYCYYYCVAKDKFGNQGNVSFSVSVENHFTLVCDGSGTGEETITISPGNSASLTARADGDDLSGVTYVWRRYKTSGGNTQTLEETGSSLSTGALDAAYDYQCTATDKYGNRETCSFYVGIENHLSASPANVGANNTVVIAKGSSATLKVNVQGDNLDGVTCRWTAYPANGPGYSVYSETATTLTTDVLDRAYRFYCTVTDQYGNTASCAFNVKIENHLSIVDENTGSTYWDINEILITPGGSATLTVVASADDASDITYQWIRYHQDGKGYWYDQTDLGTSPSQATGAQDQTYHYRCVATDKYGNTATCYYRVSIRNHLSVVSTATGSKWPDSNRVFVEKGQTTPLSVRVTADTLTGLSFQWYAGPSQSNYSMEEIDGSSDSITTQPVNEMMYYRCVVTDCYGTTEYCTFSVSVENNLRVVTETGKSSANLYLSKNQTRNLTATATANDTSGITYQWYKATQQAFNSSSSNFVACGSSAVLTSDPASIAMTYRCDVTDRYGTVAQCWYYVGIQNHFGLMNVSGTRTADSMASVFVESGQTAALQVEAYGDDLSGITYEWREAIHIWENGGVQFSPPINGATGPSLTTSAIDGYRRYGVWATDRYGNISTFGFDVSVSNGVTVEAATDRFPVTPKGTDVTMEVSVTGSAGLSYQWYTTENGNREKIVGATGTSCTRTIHQNCNIIFTATDEYGMNYSVIFVPATTEFTQIKPVIKSVSSSSGGVFLEWEPIDGAAVVWIQRMAAGESEWTDLGGVINSLTYCDTSAVNGTTYSYRIMGGYSGVHKTQASDAGSITHQIRISQDRLLLLPEGLTRIESEAFLHVSAEGVLIPPTLTEIADDAFDHIVIIGDSGTEAEQYAGRNGMTFITTAEYNTWP